MNDEEKIKLALKHIREPFWFVDMTEREREVLNLASRGFSIPKVIAPEMGFAPKSVYYHLNRATKKINKSLEKDVTFNDLTDLLLNIIEEVLTDG